MDKKAVVAIKVAVTGKACDESLRNMRLVQKTPVPNPTACSRAKASPHVTDSSMEASDNSKTPMPAIQRNAANHV
eukprot:scaffold768_cov166-Amphora_coffeaeformis.AAC.34